METISNDIFGRKNEEGNISILYADSGETVNSLDIPNSSQAWPIGSDLGCGYDHPEGIVLSEVHTQELGIEIE